MDEWEAKYRTILINASVDNILAVRKMIEQSNKIARSTGMSVNQVFKLMLTGIEEIKRIENG